MVEVIDEAIPWPVGAAPEDLWPPTRDQRPGFNPTRDGMGPGLALALLVTMVSMGTVGLAFSVAFLVLS